MSTRGQFQEWAIREAKAGRDLHGRLFWYTLDEDDLFDAWQAATAAQPEVMDLHGVRRDGSTSPALAKAGLSPTIKMREIVRGVFGEPSNPTSENDHHTDADYCLGAIEVFYKWLQAQANALNLSRAAAIDIQDATGDACGQLVRYGGGVASKELLAVLWKLTDVNDDMWHGRDKALTRAQIAEAQRLLTALGGSL